MDHNLSLIIFTIVVQASVGLFCLNALWNFRNTGSKDIGISEYRIAILSLFLALAGMIASFTHLGFPLHSFNALRNIHTSWMSREILALLMFLFSLTVLVMIRLKMISSGLSVIFRNLAFFTAVGLLYAMIRVYSLQGLTRMLQSSVIISFIATTVMSGASVLVILNIREHEKSGNLMFIAGIALFISFLNFIAYPHINPMEHNLYWICLGTYSLSILALVPALIPKLKNIYAYSAVIFVILGLISEFINRLILLSFTSFSI
jgi:anaerobic dimethyl sulfoxide reductase subunit C (anchor subunit)